MDNNNVLQFILKVLLQKNNITIKVPSYRGTYQFLWLDYAAIFHSQVLSVLSIPNNLFIKSCSFL